MRGVRAAAVALGCLSLLAACGGGATKPGAAGSPSPAGATTTAPDAGAPAPARSPEQPASRCGGPNTPASMVAPRTVDGVVLAAAEIGTGRRGVLLVPESGAAGMCGWWAYAVTLAGQGFHVLMFDQACTGRSGCPSGTGKPDDLIQDIVAALATLRADGAGPVVLVGASRGAGEVLIAGARASNGEHDLAGVTAVASFSPDLLDDQLAAPPYATPNQAAPHLRLPVLVAVAPADPLSSVPDVRHLYNAIPASDKHLSVVTDAGPAHGWDLLLHDAVTDHTPAVVAATLAFLRKHTT